MKIRKLFSFVMYLILSICLLTSLEAQQIEWSYNYGGAEYDYGRDIIQSLDGGFIFVGDSYSSDGDITNNKGSSDIWVVRLDKDGNILWSKNYGGLDNEIGVALVELENKDIVVAGYTNSSSADISTNNGSWDTWVLRLNSSGDLIWENTYGGSEADRAADIITTSDNSIVICGMTNSNNGDVSESNGSDDIWVIKLDENGNLEWDKTLGGEWNDRGLSIAEIEDGSFMVGGVSQDDYSLVGDSNNTYVARLTAEGVLEWEKTYGGSLRDSGAEIIITDDGGFIFGTDTESIDGDVDNNFGIYDYWIVKCDINGNIEWKRNYGGSSLDIFTSICKGSTSGYMLTGYTSSFTDDVERNHGGADVWVVKVDDKGDIQWSQNYGGTNNDVSHRILEASENEYVIVGDAFSNNIDLLNNNGLKDAFVIKISSQETSSSTSNLLTKSITIFPNPSTEFLYFDKDDISNNYRATIQNQNGVIVMELQNLNSKLNIRNLDKGLYFMTIYGGDKNVETHKIVVE